MLEDLEPRYDWQGCHFLISYNTSWCFWGAGEGMSGAAGLLNEICEVRRTNDVRPYVYRSSFLLPFMVIISGLAENFEAAEETDNITHKIVELKKIKTEESLKLERVTCTLMLDQKGCLVFEFELTKKADHCMWVDRSHGVGY